MPHFSTDFPIGDVPFGAGPYDERIIYDGPVAYWPLGFVGPVGYSDYDVLVESDGPVAYWPMIGKTSVTYDYDASVAGDTPVAFWPLDSIDTV